MAMAVAKCTCKTCGAKFEVRSKRYNRSDADSFEAWAESEIDECRDCRRERIEKEHDAENEAAAREAETMGLPALEGSERQVAWATTIRQKCIDGLGGVIEGWEAESESYKDGKAAQARRFVAWITGHLKASWWIDNRDYMVDAEPKERLYRLDRRLFREFLEQDETPEEQSVREAAQEEITVAPEEKTHSGVVEILVQPGKPGKVLAKYEKNQAFRKLVKGMKYRWNKEASAWEKGISVTTGTAEERAAELGNRLLNAGFAIRIADEDTRRRAVSGEFEPEYERWITWLPESNKLAIQWEQRNNTIYQRAKGIHGAKYKDGCILVSPEAFDEVEEFASMNDFHLSPGAQDAIEAQRAMVTVVSPANVPRTQYEDGEESLTGILDSSRDVLDDLKDV